MTNGAKCFSFPALAAGLLGLTGVAFGALGAHALKVPLTERGMTQAWDTAARYHLVHALAVLAVAAWAANARQTRLMSWMVGLWLAGVVLFSGSLYWLALGGPRWLGPVTPFGGIALMAGWLLVALAAFRKEP